jgi:hypothetical protein
MTRWAAALLILLPGCGTTGPVDDLTVLEAHRARWEQVGPASYVYAVERLCFCGADYRGPVRVTVVNRVVVARSYVDSGLDVPDPAAAHFPDVSGLFELLRSAYEAEAREVRVTYHPTLGVPLDFWIDFDETVADEELGMQVTEAVTPGM